MFVLLISVIQRSFYFSEYKILTAVLVDTELVCLILPEQHYFRPSAALPPLISGITSTHQRHIGALAYRGHVCHVRG